ncbi:MAG TPA: hypothetical protein VFQ44_30985 [Streptosporangiaceae bacterium]|nr:hypothetical protein [Streptosporangiaceae bacterium]
MTISSAMGHWTDGTEQVGYALIIWAALHVLDDAGSVPLGIPEVGSRIRPTPYERERNKNGGVRWETALHFQTGDATTIGWMTKRNGWSITSDGRTALGQLTSPEALYSELKRRYRDVDQQRKQAQQALNEVQKSSVKVSRKVTVQGTIRLGGAHIHGTLPSTRFSMLLTPLSPSCRLTSDQRGTRTLTRHTERSCSGGWTSPRCSAGYSRRSSSWP